MDKVIYKNDNAIVNIELIFAIVLLMSAIAAVIIIMSTLSYENRDWRIKQYTTATRAMDNLISNDELLAYDSIKPMYKVLDQEKIENLMGSGYNDGTGLKWWEFPNTTKSQMNITRYMGLGEYNLYIQLYPTDLDNFNTTLIDKNLINRVSMNIDTVSNIDRYVYIHDSSCKGEFVCYNNVTVHYKLSLWTW